MLNSSASRPRIVGIGGTTKAGSSTEKSLLACLAAAERLGADIQIIAGAQLAALPLYSPEEPARTPEQQQFGAAVGQPLGSAPLLDAVAVGQPLGNGHWATAVGQPLAS